MHNFSVNYIIDRPFTRILIRHLKQNNFSKSYWDSLYSFARNEILPVWNSAFDKSVKIRNKTALKAYFLLKNDKKNKLFNLCKTEVQKEKFVKVLKFPVRCIRFVFRKFRSFLCK